MPTDDFINKYGTNFAVGVGACVLGVSAIIVSRVNSSRKILMAFIAAIPFGGFIGPAIASIWGGDVYSIGAVSSIIGVGIFGYIAGMERMGESVGERMAKDPVKFIRELKNPTDIFKKLEPEVERRKEAAATEEAK